MWPGSESEMGRRLDAIRVTNERLPVTNVASKTFVCSNPCLKMTENFAMRRLPQANGKEIRCTFVFPLGHCPPLFFCPCKKPSDTRLISPPHSPLPTQESWDHCVISLAPRPSDRNISVVRKKGEVSITAHVASEKLNRIARQMGGKLPRTSFCHGSMSSRPTCPWALESSLKGSQGTRCMVAACSAS